MHGVRRGSRPKGAAAREQEQLAREQASLARRALSYRAASDYSPPAMEVVALALTANPDEYSLWAHRREALLRFLADSPLLHSSTDAGLAARVDVGNGNIDGVGDQRGESAPLVSENQIPRSKSEFSSLWKVELELGLAALRRHPKAYAAWHHRLWLLSAPEVIAMLPKEIHRKALRAELEMSSLLLAKDERNFHGWAHRMRTREVAATCAEVDANTARDELDFVTDKINANFANYSAWHHRSALLPVLRRFNGAECGETKADFIGNELEYVRHAFYTEPDDVQSAWFYHRWLLAGAPARGMKASVDDSVCLQELHMCKELLEIEPSARWALHAQAHLLVRLGRPSEAAPVFEKLIVLDSMRTGYYKDQLAKLTTT